MTSTRYLIIGGSAAGMAAAQSIRDIDRDGRIIVLSKEADPPYFRPLIPFLISGKKKREQIFLTGQGPYRADKIEVRLNAQAVSVNSHERLVTTKAGDTIQYEKLLIATGSSPYLPPEIGGTNLNGVYALRTLADAEHSALRANNTSHAVMLGGGLLNLKAAFALLERDIKVTLVVYSPEVLSQLMEPDDATLIRNALEKSGLNILTGASAKQIIEGKNGVNGVLLNDGRELSCQMVCIGKGVRPHCSWLSESGVEINGGVVADQFTQTNIDNIFAAGDVAVTYDAITGTPMITGLWTNAVEMGRCAGKNMSGRKTTYGGTLGILNATQVAKMPFVSMGIVHTDSANYKVHRKKTHRGYRKLVFTPDGTTLIGAVFIGDIDKAGLYQSVINSQVNISQIKHHLLAGELHFGHLLSRSKLR